jgi:methyl-accepting chemotaxis protein
MDEIVASVQRVTDIIGEISAAALEQSQGIGQVNEAVTRLDQMTQQNAALVEESAAAAESLKGQAHRMTTVVANYRLDGLSDVHSFAAAPPAHKPVAAKAIAKAAVRKPAAARATAVKPAAPKAAPAPAAAAPIPAPAPAAASGASDDWESF